MYYFEEDELDGVSQSSGFMDFYHSISHVDKLDFFIALMNGKNVEELINEIHNNVVDTFFNESAEIEIIKYATPTGQNVIICHEDTINIRSIYVNTNSIKEYKLILNDIFTDGSVLTKIPSVKIEKKYPYRFYGKYLILNNESNMIPITLS